MARVPTKLRSTEGLPVPTMSFKCRNNGKWEDLHTDAIFTGKTVIVVALPGAFTPLDTTTHLPRYNELAPTFRANGVDEIVCVSVNDEYVMEQWKKQLNAQHIMFLPDGNGEFTQSMGMLVDRDLLGLGMRSWRYSMLVVDGIIKRQFIEPDEPGNPFKVSDAETMLKYINMEALVPADVALVTKPHCSDSENILLLLRQYNVPFEEITELPPRALRAMCGTQELPQVFVGGQRVGGYEEFRKKMANADFRASLGIQPH